MKITKQQINSFGLEIHQTDELLTVDGCSEKYLRDTSLRLREFYENLPYQDQRDTFMQIVNTLISDARQAGYSDGHYDGVDETENA